MSDNNTETRSSIKAALAAFQNKPLADAATGLFEALGYASDKVADFSPNPADFIKDIEEATSAAPFQAVKIKLVQWKICAFLFQLTNDEIPTLDGAENFELKPGW
jgi:hypothetical protein